MKTRCKVTCESVTQHTGGYEYVFNFVTSGSKENEDFFKWTPHGKFEFGVTEERKFEPGKEYYVDITLAEQPNK